MHPHQLLRLNYTTVNPEANGLRLDNNYYLFNTVCKIIYNIVK